MKLNRDVVSVYALEIKAISDRLMDAKIGDVISYSELSKLIGKDVQGDGRGILARATHRALSAGSVFMTVRTVGVKCLTDSEIATSGQMSVRRVQRETRRGLRRLSLVKDFGSLPNEAKLRHNTDMSILGVLHHVTSNSQQKKLEKKVHANTGTIIPPALAMEALR